MDLPIKPEWVLLFGALIISLYLFARYVREPGRMVGGFLLRAGLGVAFMLAVNHIWGGDFTLPVNYVSAAASGLFGLPGIALVVGIGYLL